MKAKPSKCKCLALAFNVASQVYGQLDPDLKIGKHKVADIGKDAFKFLGRFLAGDLKDRKQKELLLSSFQWYMEKVDSQHLNGASKAWIYNNFVMSFITWPFIINDFPPSFTDSITATANRFLKKWLKINRPASTEILYLPEAGLNLKNPKTFLKSMQISKHHILSNSRDPKVRFLSESRLYKALEAKGNRWKPESTLLEIENTLLWESEFMRGKTTLSSRKPPLNFARTPKKLQRKLITTRARKMEADKMRIRLLDLVRNGDFTTWDNIISSDIHWYDMIYDLNESVVSFRLNAISNALPSPYNLQKWGLKGQGKCQLCNKRAATAAHILSNCYVAVRQGRYTWRHNSVLAMFSKDLFGIVKKANQHAGNSKPSRPLQCFVKTGHKTPKKPRQEKSILEKHQTNDWQINIDLYENLTIPPETDVDTLQRPDIVIYSVSKKVLIWAEETIPLERNFIQAKLRKEERYAYLKTQLQLKNWIVYDFTFEVGALGFIAKTFDNLLYSLGFVSKHRKSIRKRTAKIALRASYYLWTNRFNKHFLAPCLVPIPKQNTCSSPRTETPAQIPEEKIHPESLTKLRDLVSEMTPVDKKKWSDFDRWSGDSKRWFRKHIPLYELDCLMGIDPFTNSLQEFDPLAEIICSTEKADTSRTKTSTTGTTPPTKKSLADTFNTISMGITNSKKDCAPITGVDTFCGPPPPNLTTPATTTTSTSKITTPNQHQGYEAIDFGTPPDEYFTHDAPDNEADYFLDDWEF